MRREDLQEFRHPRTGAPLELRTDEADGDDIIRGALCSDGDEFPIVGGIPRFCPSDNYADSFGYQWQYFSKTQLDSASSWSGVSERRLYEETDWPRDLQGQRILEAGSGMGRFTEVLAKTGARVCTFDYSAAVNANRKNNGQNANLCFAQADIYQPPYQHSSFDKVLCIGVIQHCPDPKKAFMSLTRFVKPGGEIVIDHYRLFWKSFFAGKYYLRPVTRLMSPPTLHKFVRFHVGWIYPFTGAIYKLVGRPIRAIAWGLGMADYRGVFNMDDAAQREHSILDTFDMLAPAYDRPKTAGQLRRWFDEAGFVDVRVRPGWNGLEAKGRRPM